MFMREPESGVLFNTDDAHYKTILLRRSDKIKNEQLCAQLDDLRCELDDIKRLLRDMTGKKNNV